MLSDSYESSLSSNDASSPDESSSSSDEAVGIISSQFLPYMNEPLARLQDGDASEEDEANSATDEDGLTPVILEKRYEKHVPVDSWCKCGERDDEFLIGSLEFRCCREIKPAIGKLSWDGSIERFSCITQHEDFGALVNKTVLLQVGPFLKDHNGRRYRRRSGVSENE